MMARPDPDPNGSRVPEYALAALAVNLRASIQQRILRAAPDLAEALPRMTDQVAERVQRRMPALIRPAENGGHRQAHRALVRAIHDEVAAAVAADRAVSRP